MLVTTTTTITTAMLVTTTTTIAITMVGPAVAVVWTLDGGKSLEPWPLVQQDR
jgi:hypothetical protein